MTNLLLFIIKRNGEKVPFKTDRIFNAIKLAFLSDNLSDDVVVDALTKEVVMLVTQRTIPSDTVQVEHVQDIVEETLMKRGYHRIARNYIL